MNENLNLCKLLEGHEGETFYSPAFGDVILERINSSTPYPICVKTDNEHFGFSKEGKLLKSDDAEVMLFPSKDQRDWAVWAGKKQPEKWRARKHSWEQSAMSKKILFRGRRVDNGEWVYGNLVHSIDRMEIHHLTTINEVTCERMSIVSPETVGQFTQIYDVKGREIYEGDIVSWIFFGSSKEHGVVEYNKSDAQFRITINRPGNKKDSTSLQNKRRLTVIGNIHDNPKIMNHEI